MAGGGSSGGSRGGDAFLPAYHAEVARMRSRSMGALQQLRSKLGLLAAALQQLQPCTVHAAEGVKAGAGGGGPGGDGRAGGGGADRPDGASSITYASYSAQLDSIGEACKGGCGWAVWARHARVAVAGLYR